MLDRIYNSLTQWADRLNSSEWLMLLVAVVAVGFVFLKGFGSRNKY